MDGYYALQWFFKTILRLGFGLEVTGEEHVPASGPLILAVNHRSQIDPIVVVIARPLAQARSAPPLPAPARSPCPSRVHL